MKYQPYSIILTGDEVLGTGELLIGDLNAATDLKFINQHNVKTLISSSPGLQHLNISSQLTHIIFPSFDLKDKNIESFINLSNLTIDLHLKRGSVIIHCGPGISRSATLVLAYYMKKRSKTIERSLAFFKSIKPDSFQYSLFEHQLSEYEKRLGVQQQKKQQSQLQQKNHSKDVNSPLKTTKNRKD